jgi:hypothetical protein
MLRFVLKYKNNSESKREKRIQRIMGVVRC